MMKTTKILFGAGVTAGLLTMASAASAATYDYADIVTSSVAGTQDGVATPGDRTDPDNSLGAPDGEFYSIGLNGVLVLEFSPEVFAEVPNTGRVVEITFGNRAGHKESADVEFSSDGLSWSPAVSIDNQGDGISTFAFVAPIPVKFARVTDTTVATEFGGVLQDAIDAGRDGFDVDAVGILVPSPAAVTGGLGLLALLGASKLRRRSA